MEPVKTEFMLYKDQDHKAAGNPNGQAENINQRIHGIAQQIPDGHFQIATKHRIYLSGYLQLIYHISYISQFLFIAN
jgi:hypothetical protein